MAVQYLRQPVCFAYPFLRWAVARNCLLTRETTNPVFGLKGVTGERIIAFSPEWRPFSYLAPDRYVSTSERDAFVQDLQAVGLYAPDFIPKVGMNGKGTERDLTDLTDDEFERLLGSLGNYCGDASRPSGTLRRASLPTLMRKTAFDFPNA